MFEDDDDGQIDSALASLLRQLLSLPPSLTHSLHIEKEVNASKSTPSLTPPCPDPDVPTERPPAHLHALLLGVVVTAAVAEKQRVRSEHTDD